MGKNIFTNFFKYVSLNILGMIGLSFYILVDTFFVARAMGATGIAALNLSISIYSVIHGTGLMIGIGGATRYSILKAQYEDKRANKVFTTCVLLGILFGVVYMFCGIFGAKSLALLLGADASTLTYTTTYLRTILCFAPFFIMNNIILAFVRNDYNPRLSMAAMLIGSFSNIILDYIFMFPLKMGMFGAAFATGLAPIISLGILAMHFIKGNNNFSLVRSKMLWSTIGDVLSLGLSAFITEVSSAVVLITFNLVIFKLKGNLGIASYGIIANLALVGVAVFTGIAQGIQPLVSEGYGRDQMAVVKKLIKLAVITSLIIATAIYIGIFAGSDAVINIFNSEQDLTLARIVKTGLRIYFIGFFFTGINVVLVMYLSATEHAKEAFIISIARGCVIIVPMVLILSRIWDMKGIWMAYVFTEGIVCIAAVAVMVFKKLQTSIQNFEPEEEHIK